MKQFFNSLSIKLFICLFGIMVVVLVAYALTNLKTISNSWVQSMNDQALQITELIDRSTHQGMLLNRKDFAYQTIQQIAKEPGIEGIRIYDKQGRIMVSSDPEEIGSQVDLKAEACVLCHKPSETLQEVSVKNRTRTYRTENGTPILALIDPILNKPECYTSDCHAHPKEQSILGVLDVKLSMAGLDATMKTTRRQMISATLAGALLIAVVSGLFIKRLVHIPVTKLVDGAGRIAAGDFMTRFNMKGTGDLARLGTALNSMTDELAEARDEITEWSSSLEQKVMEKTEELSKSQRQVIQMEKMASLGKMAASVAHELNNPLAGILNYAKLVSRSIKEDNLPVDDRDELLRFLKHIQNESTRCGDIVRNLLLFAKQSKLTLGECSLNDVIERSLMVVRHHLDLSDIHIERSLLEGDDQVTCDANQIQQAFVALFVNAAEAMPQGGTLAVRARGTPEQLCIDVEDTGVGIAKEELPYIFEPFFSTKDKTTGVGLGLAVVYGIMQRHGGQITVDSQAVDKTVFRLTLLRKPLPEKN